MLVESGVKHHNHLFICTVYFMQYIIHRFFFAFQINIKSIKCLIMIIYDNVTFFLQFVYKNTEKCTTDTQDGSL